MKIVQKTDMKISHDPRLHDPDPGPQEKFTEKSCVSFGKDCRRAVRGSSTSGGALLFDKSSRALQRYITCVDLPNIYTCYIPLESSRAHCLEYEKMGCAVIWSALLMENFR